VFQPQERKGLIFAVDHADQNLIQPVPAFAGHTGHLLRSPMWGEKHHNPFAPHRQKIFGHTGLHFHESGKVPFHPGDAGQIAKLPHGVMVVGVAGDGGNGRQRLFISDMSRICEEREIELGQDLILNRHGVAPQSDYKARQQHNPGQQSMVSNQSNCLKFSEAPSLMPENQRAVTVLVLV